MTDDQQDASLLLEHARSKMTGREMEVCEKMALRGSLSRHAGEEGDDVSTPTSDMAVFNMLKIQHIPELTKWKEADHG